MSKVIFKTGIPAVLFFLITYHIRAQYKMEINLNNGEKISGIYTWGSYGLKAYNSEKTIGFSKMSDFKHYGKNGNTNHFYVLYYNSPNDGTKKQKIALGWKVYSGQQVELFHAIFGGRPVHRVIDTDFKMVNEVFGRRKGEKEVFSLRCRDGIGCRGIKKRLAKFFNGCPKLLNLIKNDEVDIQNTVIIAKAYEQLCF